MFSIIFVIIFMISLDAVKTISKLEKIEPKNNVIPVQIQPKYENKIAFCHALLFFLLSNWIVVFLKGMHL